MTKYQIILHDYTLKGSRYTHKKSGLYYFWLWGTHGTNIVFDSSYSAKCFLLQQSTFPKITQYLICHPDETILDKMIAKGNYYFKKSYGIPEDMKNSLLCEFAIIEVEDEDI